MAKDANTIKIVNLLVEVAKLDAVYRDVHLRRARQLLSSTLDESAYRAIGTTEKEIEELTSRSRTAALHRNWAQAAELSGQIDSMRQRVTKMGNLAKVGKEVYEADAVAFEPFSPGKHLGAGAQTNQAGLRTQAINALGSLAKMDSAARPFYEARRNYFSGLQVSAAVAQKGKQRDRAQAEKLAMEAAERGDTAALQRLAKELRDWKEGDAAATTDGAPVMASRYQCPVDLAAPFPPKVIERARVLGLVEARTEPMPELTKVREVVYAHIDQPVSSNPDMEREGVLRARTLAQNELPAQLDTEESRVLAGQFIQQIFLNSAGARYLPTLTAETVLVEDFAENESAADAPSKLLAALGLAKRSGLSRVEIESALGRSGPEIVEKALQLDPLEFRLVCIPYDLYIRFGRDRGFGKWHHWTHFDGYQVMAGNRLRALVGGDGRFGGLHDVVSISQSDAREGVYARFAVIRRARQTLRWR
jgi:hypothetical protein